jgi:hypothetical protein
LLGAVAGFLEPATIVIHPHESNPFAELTFGFILLSKRGRAKRRGLAEVPICSTERVTEKRNGARE